MRGAAPRRPLTRTIYGRPTAHRRRLAADAGVFWREAGRVSRSRVAASDPPGSVRLAGTASMDGRTYAPCGREDSPRPRRRTSGRCSLDCHPRRVGPRRLGWPTWCETRYHVSHGGPRSRLAVTTLLSRTLHAASRKHHRVA